MRLDIKKLGGAIVAMNDGKTVTQTTAIMRDVVQLLHEEQALGRWRELERAINHAWAKMYGAANVTVVSSHALSKKVRDTIVEHAHGADVTELIDDRLIGGAVVRIDNTRIDGSLTGALMRLKAAMYTEV